MLARLSVFSSLQEARREGLTSARSPLLPTPQEGRKVPASILRRSPQEHCGRGDEPRRKRHVRFREPLEVAVHCKRGGEQAAAGREGGRRPGPHGGPSAGTAVPACPHRDTQARGLGLGRVTVRETGTRAARPSLSP